MNTFTAHARARGSAKLADASQVAALMRDGYELGLSTSGRGKGSWWLQKPKLGHGGSIVFVHTSTARSMQRKGQIKLAAVNTHWQKRFELA